MRKIHLMNGAGRDATVEFQSHKTAARPSLGLPGHRVRFKRYLATTDLGQHPAMQQRFGENYAEALIAGDPEIDFEQVGREIGETTQVFLSADGEVLHAAPEIVEVIYDASGDERERRPPQNLEANINDELPLRFTGRKIARAELARRFVIGRSLQIRHVDGLTYDYLFAMAQELDGEDVVVLLGGGPKGRDPLTFTTNGTPFRGFLEGRVDGDRYILMLHLSNMELKAPAVA